MVRHGPVSGGEYVTWGQVDAFAGDVSPGDRIQRHLMMVFSNPEAALAFDCSAGCKICCFAHFGGVGPARHARADVHLSCTLAIFLNGRR